MILESRYFQLCSYALMLFACSASPAICEFSAPALPPQTSSFPTVTSLRRANLAGPYRADVTHVLDRDTFEARIRIWFGQEIATLVRIRGIDAPELQARCGEELAGAKASRAALADLLASGETLLTQISLDKYGGRIVADVTIRRQPAPVDVSSQMIASGWARPYNGGRRDMWCPLPQR